MASLVFAQNFGDALAPLVVSLVSGRPATYATGPAKLLALGSIFFALKSHDVVWGAGLAKKEHVEYARRSRPHFWGITA